jgi:hypothetical protein
MTAPVSEFSYDFSHNGNITEVYINIGSNVDPVLPGTNGVTIAFEANLNVAAQAQVGF